jgi:hypothetical protein
LVVLIVGDVVDGVAHVRGTLFQITPQITKDNLALGHVSAVHA